MDVQDTESLGCRACSGGAGDGLWRAPGVLAVLLGLLACTPTFNWRESRLADTSLLAMMPCKPETVSRDVPFVHGAVARVVVSSCEAGDITFALTTADVGDATHATPALMRWREVVSTHWQLKPGATVTALSLVRADAGAVRLRGSGRQGQQDMAVEAAFFASGSRVYQVAVIAKQPALLSADISDTFWGGLRLQ